MHFYIIKTLAKIKNDAKKVSYPHNSLLYNWRRILTVPFPASFSASTPYKATPLIMHYAFA